MAVFWLGCVLFSPVWSRTREGGSACGAMRVVQVSDEAHPACRRGSTDVASDSRGEERVDPGFGPSSQPHPLSSQRPAGGIPRQADQRKDGVPCGGAPFLFLIECLTLPIRHRRPVDETLVVHVPEAPFCRTTSIKPKCCSHCHPLKIATKLCFCFSLFHVEIKSQYFERWQREFW